MPKIGSELTVPAAKVVAVVVVVVVVAVVVVVVVVVDTIKSKSVP